MKNFGVFKTHIASQNIDLGLAALQIAQNVAFPDLSVSQYLAQLDNLALQAAQIMPIFTTIEDRAMALINYLFNELPFHGNEADYYAANNSFLNQVLDMHTGIPISLSVLYIEISRRLELEAYGISLPGHFVVGVHTEDSPLIFDVFNQGQIMTVEDCQRLVHVTHGVTQPFSSEWLEPTANADILIRMLNNLRQIYIQQEAWPEALAVVQHLRVLQPTVTTLQRDEGLLHYRTGSLQKTAFHLSEYLTKTPDAADASTVKHSLSVVLNKFVKLN